MQTAFSASTEHILVHLFGQIAVILGTSRIIGSIFNRFGQSRSVGEIISGVLLGPSLFGLLAPEAFSFIFKPAGPAILPWFSHMGLVLALFIIGMEFDFRSVMPDLKKVVVVSLATLIAPVILGFVIGPWLWSFAPGEGSRNAYYLFLGMTMAITAIPIMGRILMERDLTETRVGVLSITTGALKDVLTWFLLVVVIGVARPPIDPFKLAKMISLSAALAIISLTFGRRLIYKFQDQWGWEKDGLPSGAMIAFLLISLMLMSAATAWIGIFAIFGAFLAGVTVSSDRRLSEAVSDRFHDLTIYLFLPIFFTYTGLRCDLSTLSGYGWIAIIVVTIAGSAGSGGVAWAIARLKGLEGREALAFGALINTPGLMVLIILNIGLDLEIVPLELFSILVASAMIRNLIVTPIISKSLKAPFAASSWGASAG